MAKNEISRIDLLTSAIAGQEILQDVGYSYVYDLKRHEINRDAFKALFGKGEEVEKKWQFYYNDKNRGYYNTWYKVTVNGIDIYSKEDSYSMETPQEELDKLEQKGEE